ALAPPRRRLFPHYTRPPWRRQDGAFFPWPPDMTGRISTRSVSRSVSSSVTRSSPRTTRTLSGSSASSLSRSLTRFGPAMSSSRTGWLSNTFICSPFSPKLCLSMASGQILWASNLCIPQEHGRLFRKDRVNVKARAPFEAGDLGQLGNDLNMPMVKVPRLFMQGRSVENKVKWRRCQDAIEPPKRVGKDSSQSLDFELLE